MKRNLYLILINFRYCFIRMLEFRTEMIVWAVSSILWGILSILGVQFLFGNISSMGGWNYSDVLILTLVQNIFIGVMWWWILPSLIGFAQSVQTGKMDFYLLRPINSRFLLSFTRFDFDNYPRVILFMIVLMGYINSQVYRPTLIEILSSFLVFSIGVFIFYCLFFMITTLVFWFQNLFNLEDLFDNLDSSGRVPFNIFKGGAKYFFLLIVPAPFTATFPTLFLLGKGSPQIVVGGVLTAILFFIISQKFFEFAIKKYSSASS